MKFDPYINTETDEEVQAVVYTGPSGTVDINGAFVYAETGDWIVKLSNGKITAYAPSQFNQLFEFNGTLDEIKQRKIDELSKLCGLAIVGGFQSDALGTTHVYDSELEDQLNLVGSVTATAPTDSNPNGISQYYACRELRTGVKTYKLHTHQQLKRIAEDGAQVKLYWLQQFAMKKYEVQLQTTSSGVRAISW